MPLKRTTPVKEIPGTVKTITTVLTDNAITGLLIETEAGIYEVRKSDTYGTSLIITGDAPPPTKEGWVVKCKFDDSATSTRIHWDEASAKRDMRDKEQELGFVAGEIDKRQFPTDDAGVVAEESIPF